MFRLFVQCKISTKNRNILMPPCLVPILEIESQNVTARTSEEVRGGVVFPSDFRMGYSDAHGIPASTAGRFPVTGTYTTNHPFASKEGHSVLLSLFSFQ
jgi:hypothetical protein